MQFLRNLCALPSGTKLQDAKDGMPLAYWEELEKNKRVIAKKTSKGETWEAIDPKFWKDHLSRKEYSVLRQKGTEFPGSSAYDKFYPSEGYYACRACGNSLYAATAKFDSGSGWPSFGACMEGNVVSKPDFSSGVRREEVCCGRCNSHLGHVFAERNNNLKFDPLETFTERQCINGVCLKYITESLPEGLNTKSKLLST